MAGASSDRVVVIYKMYNAQGACIMQEEKEQFLSSCMSTIFNYSIIKPDACVRMTVDIAYPERR